MRLNEATPPAVSPTELSRKKRRMAPAFHTREDERGASLLLQRRARTRGPGPAPAPSAPGEGPLETYLVRVQLAASFIGWSSEETGVQVALALVGKVLQPADGRVGNLASH